MEILIGLAALIVVGQVVYRNTSWTSGWHDVGFIGSLLAVVVFIGAVVTIPVSRMDYMAKITAFNAVRDSRELLPGSPDIEAAAWRMKVAESNAWLAKTRYYRNTAFGLWIPDEIMSLEPIK